MKPLLIALPGNEALTEKIFEKMKECEKSKIFWHTFPDGETSISFEQSVQGREIIFVGSLHHPNEKFLPFFFSAEAARDLGALKIGLVAPYLAYMRQDKRFHPNEGITSRYFSKLISQTFDWIITVDPHLHRYSQLSEIYSIPNRVIHLAPMIAEWIKFHIKKPLLIGPDKESEQWVSSVAQRSGADFIILEKTREGDEAVKISNPSLEKWKNYTPILVDDIISTGHTLIETIKNLKKSGMLPPVCIGAHGIFSQHAYEKLIANGAKIIVTSNTIFHESNQLDVSSLIAEALLDFLSYSA